ncbi:MAG TPA: hypothetical protein VHL50_00020 [Pyrinomonadaceae bacterium]|nr:hypothetical protein [Pyrinomonadaceae bacterium]
MKLRIFLPLIILLASAAGIAAQNTALRFEVSVGSGVTPSSKDGRVFVFINKKNDREPRLVDGDVSYDAPPMLARDVKNFGIG